MIRSVHEHTTCASAWFEELFGTRRQCLLQFAEHSLMTRKLDDSSVGGPNLSCRDD